MTTQYTLGRFAPSPSGRMHLGNIYAALMSWLSARKHGGKWIVRIEDLDQQRCRPEYATQLLDDLHWLGLESDGEILYQSQRTDIYTEAFLRLKNEGIVYDCFCSRADLRASSAPHASDGTPIYPGTCRNMPADIHARMLQQRKPASRVAVGNTKTYFCDGNYGNQSCNLATECGDFVIRRSDGNFAYQLAVVVDDALSGITEVVRGCDLLPSTHQQIFLYNHLGYTPPKFYHLPLLMSTDGRRLSKRDADTDMGFLRAHYTPAQIIGLLMHLCGLCPANTHLTLNEALDIFSDFPLQAGYCIANVNSNVL